MMDIPTNFFHRGAFYMIISSPLKSYSFPAKVKSSVDPFIYKVLNQKWLNKALHLLFKKMLKGDVGSKTPPKAKKPISFLRNGSLLFIYRHFLEEGCQIENFGNFNMNFYPLFVKKSINLKSFSLITVRTLLFFSKWSFEDYRK